MPFEDIVFGKEGDGKESGVCRKSECRQNKMITLLSIAEIRS